MSVFWSSPFSFSKGTKIEAKVSASNANGEGPQSSTNTQNTVVRVKPGKVEEISRGSSSSNTQVAISWTAPSDNGGSSITDYTVQVKKGSTVLKTATSSATSYSYNTSIVEGDSYSFIVTAKNLYGSS